MSWTDLAAWWLDEIGNDHSYASVVTPLLLDILEPEPGQSYLDLGCGEGRVMRAVEARGAIAFGLDENEVLAGKSARTVVARLPSIPFRENAFDGAYSVLVLEHLEDHRTFFQEAELAVGPGGRLAIVVNHPIWTAPGSTPITDSDGEVLWRPGSYFSAGSSDVPVGEHTVRFHHRTMAELLDSAASAGWCLDSLVERPHDELPDQEGIPRLLACRWSVRRGRGTGGSDRE